MKTADFDYDLPEKYIAQEPMRPRDHSKLLVCDTANERLTHGRFFEIEKYLQPGDVLVMNESKVVPARIIFEHDGRECEILLLKQFDENRYQAMVRPGKIFKLGGQVDINERISFYVSELLEDGTRILDFFSFIDHFILKDELRRLGTLPVPPYVKTVLKKEQDYQTVYAREEGSIAAPTAGFHFTDELLERLERKGVQILKVILHVGRGTFLPVKTENVTEHRMHAEWYELKKETAEKLNQAKSEKRRIIAVGTTTVRVLESSYNDGFVAGHGETDIFIYPGYQWRTIDALITNFHLPKSTLMMLVSSFLESKGVREPVKYLKNLYETAKTENYRFYSFGDAMFIF